MRSRLALSITVVLALGLGFTTGYLVHGDSPSQSDSQYRPVASAIVTVPDLAGMTQSAARASLTSAGLVVQIVEVPSATVPKGQIVAVSPIAGSKVVAGAYVQLTVSKGHGS